MSRRWNHRSLFQKNGLGPISRPSGPTQAVVERLERRDLLAVVVIDIAKPEAVPFNGIVAKFAAGDVSGTVLDYQATINWGDGTPVDKSGATPDPSGGFDVSGTHTYLKEGVYNLSVVVTGTLNSSASGIGKATISDVAPVVSAPSFSATALSPLSGQVATFTDAGPDAPGQYAISIKWGDGTTTAGTAAAASPGPGFTVSGAHTYAAAATYPVTVSVTTLGGTTGTATVPIKVADPIPAVVARAIAPSAGVPFSGPVAAFSDADPTLTASDFVAVINWGDNTVTSAGTITGSAGLFTVSGTRTYAVAGTVPTTISVTRLVDDKTGMSTGSAVVSNPVLTPTATDIKPAAGLPFTGQVATFNDTNLSSHPTDFTATIDWGDGSPKSVVTPGLKADASGYTVTGTHTYAIANQTYPLVVTIQRISNGQTATVTGSAMVVVATLTPTAVPVTADVARPFTAQVGIFTDTNPSAQPGDFTATIDWGDSVTSAGTVAAQVGGGFQILGTHTYAVKGSDLIHVTITRTANGQVAAFTTTATVSNPEIVAMPMDIKPAAGLPFTGQVATFTDTDPTATPASFTATIDWGDGSPKSVVTPGLKADASGYTVTGTHTYAIATANQTFPLTVTISRVGTPPPPLASATATGSAMVVVATLTPTAVPVTADVARPFTAQVGIFTDTNPSAQPGDFTATIDWGDSVTSAGTVAAQVGGGFQILGTHTYAVKGSDLIHVTITRTANGQVAAFTTTATVSNPEIVAMPMDIKPAAGLPFTGQVATFTDTDPTATPASFTATIDWGDGSGPLPGMVAVKTDDGGFSVMGTHTYTIPNKFYPLIVTINRVGTPPTASATATGSATVVAATLSASGIAVSAVAGVPFAAQVATIIDSNPSAASSDYNITINWGDGSTSIPTSVTVVTPSSGSGVAFTVTGTHTYALPGSDPISVLVTRIINNSQSATATSTATVAASGLVVTKADIKASANLPFLGTVATFVDPNPAVPTNYTAKINWGDGTLPDTGTVSFQPDGGFRVQGTHIYQVPGQVYPLFVTVMRDNLQTATATGSATVTVATLSASGMPVMADAGRVFTSQVATIKDSDLSALGTDYSVTINWGDGSSSPATIISQAASTDPNFVFFNVYGSHTYGLPGMDTIRVTVTRTLRNNGQMAMVSTTATVAAAPSIISAAGTTITAIAGVPFSGVTVANFTTDATNSPAAVASDFVATINWGDGQVGSGLVSAVGGGGFKVTGGHTYAFPNSTADTNRAITVSISRAFSGETVATVASSAIVLASPISASSGTTITEAPGVQFTATVGTFAADALASQGDFSAAIDWGDNTPLTPGTVVANRDGTFHVDSTHTYANPSSLTPYTITVTVAQKFLGSAAANPTATIVSRAFVPIPTFAGGNPFSGGLAPISDTGESNSDGITRINTPTLHGTAIPFSLVQVYAGFAGGNTVVPLGSTLANADGTWSLVTGPLADGRYTLTATVTPPTGSPITGQTFANNLVIDTVGPRVQSVRYNPRSGVVTVIFQDDRSGLDLSTLQNPLNYNLVGHPSRQVAGPMPQLVGAQIVSTDPQEVAVTLNPHRPGQRFRFLRILSGGIRDVAGNALDGENTGKIPSGNGHPGGDYVGVLARGVATLHTRAASVPKGVRALTHSAHTRSSR